MVSQRYQNTRQNYNNNDNYVRIYSYRIIEGIETTAQCYSVVLHSDLACGVLTHDLWVLSNKLREQRKIRQQKLGQSNLSNTDRILLLAMLKARVSPGVALVWIRTA